MLRWIIGIVGGLIVLAGGAAVFAPMLIPQDKLRAFVQEQASAAVGREVTIGGDVRFAVLPSFSARAEGVTIANAEGFGEEPFAQIDELRVGVALAPLFARRVEVREFVLVRPNLRLEAKADGSNNWMLGAPADEPADNADNGSPTPGPSPSETDGFERTPGAVTLDARLGDVRIQDGSGVYIDHKAETQTVIEALNATFTLESFDEPLVLDSTFTLDGAPQALTATVTTLRDVFDGREAGLAATFESPTLTASFDGVIDEGASLTYSGDALVDAPSVRALSEDPAALPAGVYGPARIEGRAAGDFTRIGFDDATVTLDDLRGRGTIAIELREPRPLVTGRLSVNGVADLTPYAPAAPEGGDVTANAPASGSPSSASGAQASQAAAEPSWDTEAFDLTAFGLVDADFELEVDGLRFGAVETGSGVLTTTLRDGRLVADLQRLEAYGGAVTGELIVNAGRAALVDAERAPSFALDVSLAEINASPFLDAVAGFGRLTGAGGAELSLRGSGASLADWMQSLQGAGSYAFVDGGVGGLDIGGIRDALGELSGGQVTPQGVFGVINAARGEGQLTSFDNMGGAFTVADGVAISRDFRMQSGDFAAFGSGSLDIANQSVRFNLTPQLLDLGGDRTVAALAEGGIPLLIAGSWGGVSVEPDTEAIATAWSGLAINRLVGDDVAAGVITDVISGQGDADTVRDALSGFLRNRERDEDDDPR